MAVTYLLDTHAFVWLLGSPQRVPDRVRTELSDPSVPILVSAASSMEVATKVRLGKFDAAAALVDAWDTHLASLGATDHPVTARHALAAGGLPWDHRDPFDRLLAAQALVDNLTLVTADPHLRALPGIRLLTW